MYIQRHITTMMVALAVLLMTACASVPQRHALPEKMGGVTTVLEIPNVRYWGDAAPPDTDEWLAAPRSELDRHFQGIIGQEHHYLAISGGGANGAFGAGLLIGYAQTGKRPEFTMVTGVSTGAISAPFAFLGPGYDDQLKEIYTQYSTKDLLKSRSWWRILGGDAITSTKPLQALLKKYIDEAMLTAIAEEHRKGRRLIIGTTNLDAIRPVNWDIGRIAASGHPGSMELIHKIILASASIPAAFPPVYFNVEVDGQVYDEMHVDGGVANQMFSYPIGIDWSRVTEKLDVRGRPNVYLIRNSRLKPHYRTVEPKLLDIVNRSSSSLIRTQGIGDMYRIYLHAKKDGVNYHLAYIPDEFAREEKEPFDRAYMNELFELGYQYALEGYPWMKAPPHVEVYD